MIKSLTGLAAAILVACVCAGPAKADTTILTTGTPPPDYSGSVQVHLTDTSGIATIAIHYSWDDYVHVERLPRPNGVSILESYTCVNLGRCKDFIATGGTGDNPGITFQPHVTVNRHRTVTFYPKGNGNTVVDEHFEHGIISWIEVDMNDASQYYVFMSPPGTPTGTEYPDGLPHVLEWYFTFGATSNNAVYSSDSTAACAHHARFA